MSLRQAQREIDSREFAEWMAFDRIEPVGELRADFRSAQIVTALAGGKPADYLVWYKRDRRQSVEEQKGIFSRVFSALKRKKGQ